MSPTFRALSGLNRLGGCQPWLRRRAFLARPLHLKQNPFYGLDRHRITGQFCRLTPGLDCGHHDFAANPQRGVGVESVSLYTVRITLKGACGFGSRQSVLCKPRVAFIACQSHHWRIAIRHRLASIRCRPHLYILNNCSKVALCPMWSLESARLDLTEPISPA